MSDLTRYAQDYRGDWFAHEGGGWVQAKEAEARIAELEGWLNTYRRKVALADDLAEEVGNWFAGRPDGDDLLELVATYHGRRK